MSVAAAQTEVGEYSPQATPAENGAARDRLALWLIFTPAIAATVLSKIGVPPLASRGIGLIFPIVYAALGLGFLTGRAAFHTHRLLFLLVTVSILGLIQVVRGEPFSSTSMILMTALGIAYVVHIRLPSGAATESSVLRFFCNLTFFIAACGIVQFFAQFPLGPELAFPIEHFLPPAFVTQLFNNMNPLYWGSTTYKANGIFMLEPSVFSQVCALGLIAELCRAQLRERTRVSRLLVYAAALVVSYSGTGLIILGLCLPVYTIVHRRWDILAACAALAAILLFAADPMNLDIFAKRATEFSATGSSAFARFVAWMPMFDHHLWSDPVRTVFGYGAGAFQEAAAPFRAAEMAHSKILFEFGLLGGLLYFGFVFFCFLSSPAPLLLRLAMLVYYFMNGAYSPTVTGVAMTVLLLWSGPEVSARQPRTSAARGLTR